MLSPSALAEVADFGSEIAVSPGQLLFQAGEASYDLFVVLEGEVEVVRLDGAEPVVIVAYGPGGFVGELNLLTGQRRSLSCRVTQRRARAGDRRAGVPPADGQPPALAETIFSALLARREVLRAATARRRCASSARATRRRRCACARLPNTPTSRTRGSTSRTPTTPTRCWRAWASCRRTCPR